MFSLILAVLGLVLFFLAGLGIPSSPEPTWRYNFVAFGLFCVTLAWIVASAPALIKGGF